jgi:3-hydroxyisobutyrate dehydrogenase-like beta-hydroxyacid dehydrogenase
MTTCIGFIGFGEVGHAVAKGMTPQGVLVRAYDILIHDAGGRRALSDRAEDAGVTLAESNVEMVSPCDVVFSTVVTSNCLAAAAAAAPHLRDGQFYVDMNSAAPAVKRKAQELVECFGARYVDAGVMAAVPPRLHRVPILLAGAASADLLELLAPFGMEMEVLSPHVGDAAAAKLFQSILIKGTEALLMECLLAASQTGVERHVLDSMSRSTPGLDWVARANYMLSRTARHGARRADEMKEVVDTLTEMGIEPMVARGAAQRLRWAAERTHAKRDTNEMPGYREVIAVLRAADPE